jgi:hypothetical protein
MSNSIASSILEGNLTVLYSLPNAKSHLNIVPAYELDYKQLKIKFMKTKYGELMSLIQIPTPLKINLTGSKSCATKH